MKFLHKMYLAVLCIAFTAPNLFSQYYSEDIFVNPDQFANWGEVSQFGDKGNLITGFTTYNTPVGFFKHALVHRSDPNGVVTYGNMYSIWNGFTRYDVYACFGSELPGSFVGLAGIVQDTASPNNYIFYARLDPAGNPLNAVRIVGNGTSQYEIKGIYNDLANNRYLICGSAFQNGPGYRMGFVIAVNPNTGAIIWNRVYDLNPAGANLDTKVYDVVFNPMTFEYVMVGSYGIGINNEAFAFTTNFGGNPGGGIGIPKMFGTAASDDVFTSVDFVNSGGFLGLIISGYTNRRGNYDAWGVQGDMALTPPSIASRLFDHAGLNYNNRANHIIHRVDMGGGDTYFLGGNVNKPTSTGGLYSDIDIYKIDNFFNPTVNFTEGTNATNDLCAQLGKYDGSTGFNMGLMSFGTKRYITPGWSDHHLNKFYFSGDMPCNQLFWPKVVYKGPVAYSGVLFAGTAFYNQPAQIRIEAPTNDAYLCYGTVATGNNFKTAPNAGIESVLFSQSALAISLEVEGESAVNAELLVTDVMGRVWMQKNIQLEAGHTELELSNPLGQVSAGVYLVTLRSELGTVTKRVFVD